VADPLIFAVRGAVVRYGGRTALGPIDVGIGRGEIVALLGPSGSGKSTLLRLLLGLVAPDAGAVSFDGAPPTRAARLRLGTVIQDGGLFPHLTAAENVTLLARELSWERARTAARLEELRALTDFPADGLARYPAALSGGQRQRVALMRALFLDPEALLLDEPLGALDPLIRAELQAELAKIFARLGKTVVLVTHDVVEAARLSSRVVLLEAGRVVQDGPLAELAAAPAAPFVTRFLEAQRPPEGLW
jgi:osmoprotectant transport system ATP-binding protein